MYTNHSAFVITILLLKFKIGNKMNYVELYFSFAYSQVYSYIYIRALHLGFAWEDWVGTIV